MKFTTDRKAFAAACGWVNQSLPARPAQPILGYIPVTAAGGRVTFSSFDYDTAAVAPIAAEVADTLADDAGDGTVLLPGRLLTQIARSLPDAPVTVALDEQGTTVTVKSGRATFTLPCGPPDDYPALPDVPPVSGVADCTVWRQAVAQVTPAAGPDDTLPVLTGARLETSGDTLTVVATDRYRLAIREIQWKPATDAETAVVVPARFLTATAKTMPGDDITIGFGDGVVSFQSGGWRASARVLPGDFPKYRNLLPDTFDSYADVEAAPFAEAVKRVALVTGQAPIRLIFTEDTLQLAGGGGDDGAATDSIEAAYSGDADVSIAFNPQYLLDGIGAVDATSVRISMNGPGKAAVLAAPPDDGPADFRYLLMPVRQAS